MIHEVFDIGLMFLCTISLSYNLYAFLFLRGIKFRRELRYSRDRKLTKEEYERLKEKLLTLNPNKLNSGWAVRDMTSFQVDMFGDRNRGNTNESTKY